MAEGDQRAKLDALIKANTGIEAIKDDETLNWLKQKGEESIKIGIVERQIEQDQKLKKLDQKLKEWSIACVFGTADGNFKQPQIGTNTAVTPIIIGNTRMVNGKKVTIPGANVTKLGQENGLWIPVKEVTIPWKYPGRDFKIIPSCLVAQARVWQR